MLLKCYTQYVSKFGKLGSGHRTGKGQFSFPSQRRIMVKKVQTTIRLHQHYMLPRLCSKFFKVGFSRTWIKNFLMYKLNWEKAKEPEIKLITFVGSWRKQSGSRKHLFCFFDYTKDLTVWITTNCGKFLKDGSTRTTYLSPEKPVCRSRSNSQNETWYNRLVPDWRRIASRLGTVISLFNLYLECTLWIISRNQDFW